jgi:hypothetical protein
VRLSDENARRLMSLVWRDRLRRALPFVLVAVLIAGGATFFFVERLARADRTLGLTAHEGTVVNVKQLGAARGAAVVQVHLDDGRDVDAFSFIKVVPIPGAHVQVSEARHASGKLTYDVRGLTD